MSRVRTASAWAPVCSGLWEIAGGGYQVDVYVEAVCKSAGDSSLILPARDASRDRIEVAGLIQDRISTGARRSPLAPITLIHSRRCTAARRRLFVGFSWPHVSAQVVPTDGRLTMVKMACCNAARPKSVWQMAYSVWSGRREVWLPAPILSGLCH